MRFPTLGETFEGRYRIESVLGSGGFARVYRGVELGLGRDVALKLLRPPTVDSQSDSERDQYLETLMRRFKREAQLLSKLRSPYTVTMYQYGQTESGLLYMALEYIDGISLAELLRSGTPVAEDRVAKILKQVLMSLKEAHAMGMLHRDLKPANIMIYDHMDDRDQVKLLDFGIAKTLGDAAARTDITSDGTLIGTPRYMAPEQIQGNAEKLGPASDIYALGLVGYELLVGERAIQGDNSIQIIGKQLSPKSFVLPPSATCTPSLRGIVNRMMAKSLDDRYTNASDVIDDLEAENIPFITLEPLPPAEDFDVPVEASIEILDSEFPRQFGEPRRVPIAIIGGALAGLAIVISIAVLFGGDDPEAKVADAPIQVPPTPPIQALEIPQEISETMVASNRTGVVILVNGERVGIAPISIKPEHLPAVVTAQLGDDSMTATLTERLPTLILRFPDPPPLAKKDKKLVKRRNTRKTTHHRPKSKTAGNRPKSGSKSDSKKPNPRPKYDGLE